MSDTKTSKIRNESHIKTYNYKVTAEIKRLKIETSSTLDTKILWKRRIIKYNLDHQKT
jgi:hypothetical protein